MAQIIPTAEPFFFPGAAGQPGVLLIHGFTGTPQSLRPMGEYLSRTRGFACLGVRLAGHATSPQDMARSHYQDWLASVEDGFDLLAGVAGHIYLAGFSMGGALALTLANRLPGRGIIAMATPFDLAHDWRLRVTGLLALLKPFLPKQAATAGADWYDKEAKKDYVAYASNPVRSIAELNKLLARMRAELPRVRLPVLLIQSRQDDYPIPESMPLIFEKLGSADKQALWIEGSSHLITLDAQRESVFMAAAEFIARLESGAVQAPSTDPAERPLVADPPPLT
jgi:carboxylesterase